MLVFLLALLLCEVLAEPPGERPAHPVPEELFLRSFLTFPGAAIASRQARLVSARYQLPQRATCSSLAGPGFCIYDAAAELHPGKAEAAQGRCAAPQEAGADEQARAAEQRRRTGGGAGRASEARASEAGGAGGMRSQDAGFGGLHPHNAEGWGDEDSGAAMRYMDASLRGLREEEKESKARADDVVVVRAGRSVRSVYDDDAVQEGADGAGVERAGDGAGAARAAARNAGSRAGAAGRGAGVAGAGGTVAGEGPGVAGAKLVTQEDLNAAVAAFERVTQEYVALLQRPHHNLELRAMEARKAASRAHFDRMAAAYHAQTERKQARVAAALSAHASDSPTAGPPGPTAGGAEQAPPSVEGLGSRAETGPAVAAAAARAPGAGSRAGPGTPLANPAAPAAEALARARARDRARRPPPPVAPYDDSDYDEGSPAVAGGEGALRPGSGSAGSGGSGSQAASARGQAGGEGRVRAAARAGRERVSPRAAKPGAGGEFEAGAALDARSAAELGRLDTYEQAQEAYPAWEEELFGSPAGNYTYGDYTEYPYDELYEYEEETPGY